MKKILITSLFLLLIPLISKAITVTTSQIGATTHYSFSDGVNGTSFQIGGTTHYSFSNGISGTSFQIGATTHYSFSDPISKKSYDLGNGNQTPVHIYTPGEYYSNSGPTLINNTCKGLNSNVYPDWTKRGAELTIKCLGEERILSSDSDWSSFGYQNAISKCTHESPEKALKEILDICTKEQAKLYINRVNLIESNSQEKKYPCPQFSVFWTDTPGCTKETEQAFPINKNDCCVCYLDYRNYNKDCIPEADYAKKIRADVENKKAAISSEANFKQKLSQNDNSEEDLIASNTQIIPNENNNPADEQRIINTNIEPQNNNIKTPWLKRLINSFFSFFKRK